MDLSSPRGSSINDFICKEYYTLHYATFDQALALVSSFGTVALMAKLDLKHAVMIHYDFKERQEQYKLNSALMSAM